MQQKAKRKALMAAVTAAREADKETRAVSSVLLFQLSSSDFDVFWQVLTEPCRLREDEEQRRRSGKRRMIFGPHAR